MAESSSGPTSPHSAPPQLWWRPPGQKEIFTLVPDDHGTTSFHFVPFSARGTVDALRWKGHVVTSEGPKESMLALPRGSAVASTTQSEHLQMVRSALRRIEEGSLDKVVVSRTQWISSRSRPEEAFQKLCQMHPRALVYLMHHPEEGTWCGATPELLLRAQQEDVHTVSLAGTRSQDDSVQWTDKERLEQKVVTDHILDVLAQQGAEDVALEGPQDRSYGDLVHLETRVSAKYKGALDQLAMALHPTPAVCGRPEQEAKAFIQSHERHARTYYAGFLGWSSPLGCAYYVNLRCASWTNEGVQLFAGGGIVAGSEPEAEWTETEAKLQSFAPAFQD